MTKKLIAIAFFAATVLSARSQELFFDGGVALNFDNTEYDGSECGTSRTIFTTDLTASLGYRWEKYHSVVAGADITRDLGSSKFINQANLVAYYRFDNEKYRVLAGMFRRDDLIGRYSRAFYSDSTLIYNSIVQGLGMSYRRGGSYAELAVDWVGIHAADTREHFRVLFSAGGGFGRYFDAGISLSLQHFANKTTFTKNVVDNILLNPHIGAQFSAVLDFEVRLGYLQSLQRDRMAENGWAAPRGGELYIRMGWKGIFVDNNLYVGKSLTPFWHSVGKDGLPYADHLYTCDPFYGTTHGLYNRTGIGYERRFLKDQLSVKAAMVLQCAGAKVYYQQLIGLTARINPVIYNKSKHK